MAGFLHKIKSASVTSAQPNGTSPIAKKKDDQAAPEVTPLEKMLQHAGPLREDGSDRFYGFENFGNTCYCNSIVQALFYTDLFRDNVVQYPSHSAPDTPNGTNPKVNVTIRAPPVPEPPSPPEPKKKPSASQILKDRKALNSGQVPPTPVKPEDKPDSPEYKKKQAMIKGPIVELARENAISYGMDECTFTGLKDIFLALRESQTRIGVLSPQRFLEIFKRDNELFRNSMHQDAHEFYGVLLNDVISNVEANAQRLQEQQLQGHDGLIGSVQNALGNALPGNYKPSVTGWVHDIFEGLLTSQTRCLTCETSSQRDETFLDLSIDLEEHSSVTSCLRKFSAEEMLCERNKFHCDHCGGLQEAEKRMKVKRLPKVLTLHLKRFKYTEDYSRLQKLFHRVVYPYHLRLFNTTEDAEDPDRLYELYAVVVHIGGNAYHGHYVSIIKTKDRGWLLFDDEMVEPVDKHYVRNFFGDKPGTATAYVLFYRETTFEKVREEQEAEGTEEVMLANQAANLAQEDGSNAESSPLKRLATQPAPPIAEHEPGTQLAHAKTAPDPEHPSLINSSVNGATTASTAGPGGSDLSRTDSKPDAKSKLDKKREKEERKAAEKAEKLALKDREKELREAEKQRKLNQMRLLQQRRAEQEEFQKVLEDSKKSAAQEEKARKKDGNSASLPSRGKSMSRKSFGIFGKDKDKDPDTMETTASTNLPDPKEKTKGRLSMGLGRKKSQNMLS